MLTITPDELLQGPRIDPHAWLNKRWEDYLIGPDMDIHPYRLNDIPEEANCVYFLWSATKNLKYVGLTNSPRKRFLAHKTAGRFNFAYWGGMLLRYELCPVVERAYIFALNPPENRMYECCRWAGKERMQAAIREIWGL